MRKKCLKIWMFPEGTRHHQHGFLPFRKGAFNIAVQGQFPIIPVVISDYTPFYSKPKRYFRSKGHVIVQVMDPVSTQGVSFFVSFQENSLKNYSLRMMMLLHCVTGFRFRKFFVTINYINSILEGNG